MDVGSLEVNMLKALANPTRLWIMKMLREKVYCVYELNKHVEIPQSSLSQHLKILKDAGLVEFEKEGMKINYKAKDPRLFEVLGIIERMVFNCIKELKVDLDE